jgi:3-hydroxybutyrate dehydrogenase
LNITSPLPSHHLDIINMDKLEGKIALVTGGGSGINLAFVKLLVNAGCNVLIADISLHPQAQEYLKTLPPRQKASGSGSSTEVVSFQKTDVSDWSQLARAFDVCHERFGEVPDIVVPGAGVYEPSSNSFWKDCDEDSRYKVLDIDLVHPIKASRMAIRLMTQAGKRGSIIHVSSIAGQRSSIVTPLYTAAKHGINSFVRGMAPLEELAGIRIAAVAPG